MNGGYPEYGTIPNGVSISVFEGEYRATPRRWLVCRLIRRIHRGGSIWGLPGQGKGVVVIVGKGERLNLWTIPVDGSAPKQVTDFDLPIVFRREYSLDGKQIALVRGEGVGNAIMITGYR